MNNRLEKLMETPKTRPGGNGIRKFYKLSDVLTEYIMHREVVFYWEKLINEKEIEASP